MPALLQLIENRKFGEVKQQLIEMNSVDVASLFEQFPPESQPRIFRLLPKELAAETFVELESDLQQSLIEGLTDRE